MLGHQRHYQPTYGSSKGLFYDLHLDGPLLFGLVILSIISLVVLYSASGQDIDIVYKQMIRLLLAFAVMGIVAQISHQTLERWTPWFFGLCIIMLVGVLVWGHIGKGAQRWLDIGPLRFQPSELLKLGVPMILAWYLAEQSLPPRLSRLLICGVLIVVPAVLIAKQPDLGTALLTAVSGVFVLLLAGMRWKLVAIISLLGAAMSPLLWYVMHDFQRQRVLTLFNPESDPLGAGYHIIQSKIAIGSGGLYGKGWLNGSQSQLEFLPERTTDFIFAVYAEEFGLIGSLGLLAIYLFIVARGLYLASQAQTTFGRLLGGSLVLVFFIHTLINIGMVIGLLPVVGLPLPLISYGGTSVVIIMASFGMLMSIFTHRKMLSP